MLKLLKIISILVLLPALAFAEGDNTSFVTTTTDGWSTPVKNSGLIRIGWEGDVENKSIYDSEVGVTLFLVDEKNYALAVLETPLAPLDKLDKIAFKVLFEVEGDVWRKTSVVKVAAMGRFTDPVMREDAQAYEERQKEIFDAARERELRQARSKAEQKQKDEEEKQKLILKAIKENKATVLVNEK